MCEVEDLRRVGAIQALTGQEFGSAARAMTHVGDLGLEEALHVKVISLVISLEELAAPEFLAMTVLGRGEYGSCARVCPPFVRDTFAFPQIPMSSFGFGQGFVRGILDVLNCVKKSPLIFDEMIVVLARNSLDVEGVFVLRVRAVVIESWRG